MTEEIKLKSCPFCGGEAEIIDDAMGTISRCRCCGAENGNGVYGAEGHKLAVKDWNTRPIEDALNKEAERFKRYALSLEDEIKDLRKALDVVRKAEKSLMRSKYMGTPLEKIINDAIKQHEETFTEDFNKTISGVLKTDRERLMEALELIQKTGQERPFDGNACAYIAELALSGKHATVEWQNIEKEINKEEDEMNLKGGKQ